MRESMGRIAAMFLRYFYILRGSPVRLVEILYWPTLQVVLWGFISRYFASSQATGLDYVLGTLLGGVMLWDLMFRAQIGISTAWLEELWSRNLGHLFISPLRPLELWCAMILFSVFRALLGSVPAALIAIPFYGFSIFDLGFPLLLFFLNLLFMGWWLGFFIMSVLIRVGPAAESMAWAFPFLLAPLSAVYYPVSILPEWLQKVALILPSSHVFEGLRALVRQGVLDAQHMWAAFLLNCAYTALALVCLGLALNYARREGTLLQTGE